MMKVSRKWILRPFERIAGWKALAWGLAGMAVSTVLSFYSGYHYHGLLHYGPAPNDAWWMYVIEHLIVWLVPALFFWAGGKIFSRSKIRTIDVLGTVAFAQLPLLGMGIFEFLPAMQRIKEWNTSLPMDDILAMERFAGDVTLAMISLVFIVWMFIWMFNALKVSCNLKGGRLWGIYLTGMIGGEILCRLLIPVFY